MIGRKGYDVRRMCEVGTQKFSGPMLLLMCKPQRKIISEMLPTLPCVLAERRKLQKQGHLFWHITIKTEGEFCVHVEAQQLITRIESVYLHKEREKGGGENMTTHDCEACHLNQ